jgi:hypothetical protein
MRQVSRDVWSASGLMLHEGDKTQSIEKITE